MILYDDSHTNKNHCVCVCVCDANVPLKLKANMPIRKKARTSTVSVSVSKTPAPIGEGIPIVDAPPTSSMAQWEVCGRILGLNMDHVTTSIAPSRLLTPSVFSAPTEASATLKLSGSTMNGETPVCGGLPVKVKEIDSPLTPTMSNMKMWNENSGLSGVPCMSNDFVLSIDLSHIASWALSSRAPMPINVTVDVSSVINAYTFLSSLRTIANMPPLD